jgi:hypothetical protein
VFEFLIEQGRLMLTGIIITFISALIYTITPTGFKSAGKYRKKEEAVVIYLGAALILGSITPFIYVFSQLVLDVVPAISIVGFFIFCANFIINQRVRTWSHTTPKTLLIYAIGIVLIILGFLFVF